MNEKKIKELEAKIKVLKEEKSRTDREILESIEKLLEKMLYRTPVKSDETLLRESLPFGVILESELNHKPFRLSYPTGNKIKKGY